MGNTKTAMQIMWEGLNNTRPEQWAEMLLNDKDWDHPGSKALPVQW